MWAVTSNVTLVKTSDEHQKANAPTLWSRQRQRRTHLENLTPLEVPSVLVPSADLHVIAMVAPEATRGQAR